MKFKSLITAALLTTLTVGAAHAGNNWLGVQAGAGLPSGDFGDAASTGWNFGANGTHMINHQWGFGGDLAYNAWSGSDDVSTALGPNADVKWTAFQATAHAIAMFPSNGNMTPYGKFGLGVYNVGNSIENATPATLNGDSSESKLGFNFGGGMNWATQSNMRWGVNAGYHVVPMDGGNLNFFSMGVNLMWGVGQ